MNQDTRQAETFVERRKFARYSLRLRVQYSKAKGDKAVRTPQESISRDLGVGGMALVLEEKLEPGQTLSVNIDLPDVQDLITDQNNEAMSAAGKTVTLLASVVWIKPAPDNQFLAGIRFLDLNHEDAIALKGFLEEYRLKESSAGDSD
ncbi:MAG: PilZ domain-containing protein [Syntrophaceae bacterium]|nr:PilZ domain-containing protein [Syntrophaceae bacterium]